MSASITLPVIHLNGTSARCLAEDYSSAACSVRAAIRRLARSAILGGSSSFAIFEREAWDIAKRYDARNDFGLHGLFDRTFKADSRPIDGGAL